MPSRSVADTMGCQVKDGQSIWLWRNEHLKNEKTGLIWSLLQCLHAPFVGSLVLMYELW